MALNKKRVIHRYHCLLLTAICLIGSGKLIASQQETNEIDEVRQTVLAFYRAIESNQSKSALGMLTHSNQMQQWTDSMIAVNQNIVRFNRSVKDKFKDTQSLKLMSPPVLALIEKAKTADLKIANDEAFINLNPQSPMRLVKEKGQWKVDIMSSYDKPSVIKVLGVKTGEQALLLATVKIQAQANLFKTIADDLDNGKFDSIEAMQQKFRNEINQLNDRAFEAFQKAIKEQKQDS